MATVLTWPNKKLTKVAKLVEEGDRCRELIDVMYQAMDYPNGIGLAAPQIGVDKRIIVLQVPPPRKFNRQVSGCTKIAIINPELFWWKGGMILDYEGCLSFPGERVLVPRWPRVKVRGFDVRWNPVTFGGKGLVARVLQHEIDHLNGRTLDHYAKIAEQVLAEEQVLADEDEAKVSEAKNE